ncbi:DUF2624 domain-containing protein [Peribacillus sp. SCS-155]|uniref:DUF2624 domain-containing protein n=1 Tax=Peribacillus sedimenti TaxID=3115297 RepID=UPI0039058F6F
MKLFEIMINHKLNNITPEELVKLASQHNVTLTSAQASTISRLVNGKNINVFNQAEREALIKKIARATGVGTAAELESIFKQLTATL